MAKASWMLRNKDITLAVPGRNICTSWRGSAGCHGSIGQKCLTGTQIENMPTAHLYRYYPLLHTHKTKHKQDINYIYNVIYIYINILYII